ncbi:MULTISPECIES: FHA domain-containing protein [Thermomonas]|uniref:FHA domain-containing protein n=1 Tax=Thermomonas fusca TaxID=215690 RepID=A0A5R9PFQ1_9GAMM|nr:MULTISPECIES: FHA domain-containing protein [Thermomonas]TLX21430.1 FHA domain-containing protein [Thermomonas fusca]
MNDLHLRFCDGRQPDLPLEPGVHALGRTAVGLGPVAADGPALLQLCNDRRGIWMTVTEGMRGVHVNGRPVQQVAMLRAGDSIHADGSELLLYAANDDRTPSPSTSAVRDPAGNLRMVLRGVGGPYHGRCISLDRPCHVGSAAAADLRIEGAGIAAEHALLEAGNGQALLRNAAADVLVNGRPLRQAVLHSGDQIAFGVQHRFVLEGPPPPAAEQPRTAPPTEADAPPVPPRRRWTQGVPWLLLAALLLAAALTALLVFGAR